MKAVWQQFYWAVSFTVWAACRKGFGREWRRRERRRRGHRSSCDGRLPASQSEQSLNSVSWGDLSLGSVWRTAPIITTHLRTHTLLSRGRPTCADECVCVSLPSLLQYSGGGADRQVTPPEWPPRFLCSVAVGTCHTFTVVSRLSGGQQW